MILDKINRVIYSIPRKMNVKIHLRLRGKRNKSNNVETLQNVYITDSGQYLKIDVDTYLTLECLGDKEWRPDKSIMLTTNTLVHFIKALKKIIKNIYEGGMFALKTNGELFMYSDKAEENVVRAYNLGMNQRIIIKTCIVEYQQTTYEGAVIYINKFDNYIELTIDELEGLLHTLEKIDLFMYSQTLLNYYMNLVKDKMSEVLGEVDMTAPKPQKRSVFEENSQSVPKEHVTDNLIKDTKDEKDVFGF